MRTPTPPVPNASPAEERDQQFEVLDEALLAQIDQSLDRWDQQDSEGRKRYELSQAAQAERLNPLLDAIKASERLTEADFAIRINTRD